MRAWARKNKYQIDKLSLLLSLTASIGLIILVALFRLLSDKDIWILFAAYLLGMVKSLALGVHFYIRKNKIYWFFILLALSLVGLICSYFVA